MYGANLSFLQLEKYLSALLGSGLLAHEGDSGYLVTGTGIEFLQLYADHLEQSTRLRGDVETNEKNRQQLENMCGIGREDFQL